MHFSGWLQLVQFPWSTAGQVTSHPFLGYIERMRQSKPISLKTGCPCWRFPTLHGFHTLSFVCSQLVAVACQSVSILPSTSNQLPSQTKSKHSSGLPLQAVQVPRLTLGHDLMHTLGTGKSGDIRGAGKPARMAILIEPRTLHSRLLRCRLHHNSPDTVHCGPRRVLHAELKSLVASCRFQFLPCRRSRQRHT